MKKMIGMAVVIMVAAAGSIFAADEPPSVVGETVGAVTEVRDEATGVVKSGIDRRQTRREAIAPAAGEVSKEATGIVTGVADRRQARRDARRRAILAPKRASSAEAAAEKK